MATDQSPRSITSSISSTTNSIHTPISPTRTERKFKRMAPPPPPPHLSEFLSYVNGNTSSNTTNSDESKQISLDASNNNNNNTNKIKSKNRKKRSDNTSWSIHSNISNPSFSSLTSMTPTTMDLDVLVTKNDVKESLEQMQELKLSCDNLSKKLKEVSEAFGDFGEIIEKISRSKGSGDYCNALSTFSNYQYLISNQHRYLGELLQRDFGDKIKDISNDYYSQNENRRIQFQSEYKKLVKELKSSEVANSKLRKGKIRNLVTYKSNLVNLTTKLENIDHVYHDYYVDCFNMWENTNGKIVSHAKNVVSHESLVFNKLAEKTLPGNGLDVLLLRENPNDDDFEDGDTTIQESSIIEDTQHEIKEDSIQSSQLKEDSNLQNVLPVGEEEEEDIAKQDERYMQNAVNLLHSAIDSVDEDTTTTTTTTTKTTNSTNTTNNKNNFDNNFDNNTDTNADNNNTNNNKDNKDDKDNDLVPSI